MTYKDFQGTILFSPKARNLRMAPGPVNPEPEIPVALAPAHPDASSPAGREAASNLKALSFGAMGG